MTQPQDDGVNYEVDNPDHEFQPIAICGTCEQYHIDCVCEDFEYQELDECEYCGKTEGEGDH